MVTEQDIRQFLRSLKDERNHFFFEEDRVAGSEVVVPSLDGENGKLVGLTGIYRRYGIPTFFIVVKKQWQKQGRARSMMEELNGLLQARGYHFCLLTVHSDNKRARLLYEKQGYKHIGRIGPVDYMVLSLDPGGMLVRILLKILFPIIRIIRKNKHT